ncbi:phosphoenolpyruvate carboxykinase [Desulfuromonas acetoxidans]|uniref:phosphoenolpyruvate carboxykinase n=1 Tax=Desulfuromonas acetoxidans TaxID=891 RepID=UPI0015940911|nr:phosphoenolpyruvate carboxykinase [Desulfuromonas acetoxidans]MBF0644218.1 phosphoenolpyruvate carboxykinase [Desulfuromonas acetoxidans]NVD24912.1 phosphoenolpyruvate carboxykinase [Desulfuromonas acetoxidans]NVE15213.1 phosphoenolpyruvate carboxykinase [Desulfuromonas acetoxidans]
MSQSETACGNLLEQHGITNVKSVQRNLCTPALYEEIIRRGEGSLSHQGPIVVSNSNYTGRSPNDRFIVKAGQSGEDIWWGDVNRPFDPDKFDALYNRMMAFLQERDLFVQDCFAGADKDYRLPVRVVSTRAWNSLFARNMLIKATDAELENFVPGFTVVAAPDFKTVPEIDGTRSEAAIIINFERKLILIATAAYSGEIKKGVFSVLNYLLPKQGVLPMHCSANVGANGDTAIFFGLSGTGKTTLSADPNRRLIGDDEHGWTDKGVFNFEGGCYAKVINLSPEAEPEIFKCTRSFGTILENVGMDATTRYVDLDDASITENTRAAYPISHIPNIVPEAQAGNPKNIIMLTADAFGVMPPISKLTPEQAMYHFISGYTAKLAGTEKGVTEPQTTFSACFGAPFMPLHPSEYGNLLKDKIREHNVSCWLVNTGWSGGPYGIGSRMKIRYTRAMLNAALEGKLDKVDFEQDPIFGLHIPQSCPDVPAEVLNPRNTWEDKAAYDAKATELAKAFHANFAKFADGVTEEIRNAGPLAK